MREEWGRLTSLLLARFRRLDLVEDALGRRGRDRGPALAARRRAGQPAAWLHTAARRRVLDRLRAESMAQRKVPLLVVEAEQRKEGQPCVADPGDLVEDDLLRLVLMCTHPALDPAAASALALRLVLGVSTADIARLFLVPEPTMAARITRAKKKIVTAGIPFAVPVGRGAARPPGRRRPDRLPRLHGRVRARPRSRRRCAPTSPARRSGWSGSCSACARTSRCWSPCWP